MIKLTFKRRYTHYWREQKLRIPSCILQCTALLHLHKHAAGSELHTCCVDYVKCATISRYLLQLDMKRVKKTWLILSIIEHFLVLSESVGQTFIIIINVFMFPSLVLVSKALPPGSHFRQTPEQHLHYPLTSNFQLPTSNF